MRQDQLQAWAAAWQRWWRRRSKYLRRSEPVSLARGSRKGHPTARRVWDQSLSFVSVSSLTAPLLVCPGFLKLQEKLWLYRQRTRNKTLENIKEIPEMRKLGKKSLNSVCESTQVSGLLSSHTCEKQTQRNTGFENYGRARQSPCSQVWSTGKAFGRDEVDSSTHRRDRTCTLNVKTLLAQKKVNILQWILTRWPLS